MLLISTNLCSNNYLILFVTIVSLNDLVIHFNRYIGSNFIYVEHIYFEVYAQIHITVTKLYINFGYNKNVKIMDIKSFEEYCFRAYIYSYIQSIHMT